ncbi:hypothetical protein Smed_6331 (plasmid) [Sinorhizobium medicae WSM419]|uniref:Uncharacterized protein n=1 Tax=Sinorhizobium medicae (strain WSM419) TaxID=366394 RepID=A6UMP6_SINMW|nr:hypothetical protein Smed_6331 [Sinorhizobium medicae WSM419]
MLRLTRIDLNVETPPAQPCEVFVLFSRTEGIPINIVANTRQFVVGMLPDGPWISAWQSH